MNDQALMEMASRLDPVPADAYRGLADSKWGRRTFETVVSAGLSRRRLARGFAAAAVTAAVVAGAVAVVSTEPPAPKPESAWAPELVRLAQESPRLLITAPGWRVTRADGFGSGSEEMTFENGRYWVDIYWYPREDYERYVDSRRHDADVSAELRVAGNGAVLFRQDGNAPIRTTFYVLWKEGPHTVELRTDVVPSTAELREIASSVEAVDVETWLAALPPSVVEPAERHRTVERAAAGLPIPPEVDLDRIAGAEAVGAGHSIEYEVATAVACGWIEHWAEGDEAARREAVEALRSAGEWRAFRDGNMQLEYIEDVAAGMANGEPAPGGEASSLEAGYRRHLGCEGS